MIYLKNEGLGLKSDRKPNGGRNVSVKTKYFHFLKTKIGKPWNKILEKNGKNITCHKIYTIVPGGILQIIIRYLILQW